MSPKDHLPPNDLLLPSESLSPNEHPEAIDNALAHPPAHRVASLVHARQYTARIHEQSVLGNPLRPTQKLAAVGFEHWLREGILTPRLMGHIVKPMGSGKTETALVLSEMTGGRAVIIGTNNDNCDDFYARAQQHFARTDTGKTIGKCYGATRDVSRDITITHFHLAHAWHAQMAWDTVSLILVDEADVNALSRERRAMLRELADTYHIPIIGMSGTEMLASGRAIQDVFTDEILHLPIPESLPQCIDMGITPPLEFRDIAVDARMEVDLNEIARFGDARDARIDALMQHDGWLNAILDDFQQKFHAPTGKGYGPGVFVFRNNAPVARLCELARERGIRIAPMIGDMNTDARRRVKEDLRTGALDGVAGSALVGRAFNIDNLVVCYNSTATYSPQLFWQASGRVFRFDPASESRVMHAVAVVPGTVYDLATHTELTRHNQPLSHASFLDEKYWEMPPKAREQSTENAAPVKKQRNAAAYKVTPSTKIASVGDVAAHMRSARVDLISFFGNARLITRTLRSARTLPMDRANVRTLLATYADDMRSFVAHTRADAAYTVPDAAASLYDAERDMTMTDMQERMLLAQYHANFETSESESARREINPQEWQRIRDVFDRRVQDEALAALRVSTPGIEARNKLIEGYLPFLRAVAGHFACADASIDDLVHEGVMALSYLMQYDNAHRRTRQRLVKSSLWYIMQAMQDYVRTVSTVSGVTAQNFATRDRLAALESAHAARGEMLTPELIAAEISPRITRYALPTQHALVAKMLDDVAATERPENTDFYAVSGGSTDVVAGADTAAGTDRATSTDAMAGHDALTNDDELSITHADTIRDPQALTPEESVDVRGIVTVVRRTVQDYIKREYLTPETQPSLLGVPRSLVFDAIYHAGVFNAKYFDTQPQPPALPSLIGNPAVWNELCASLRDREPASISNSAAFGDSFIRSSFMHDYHLFSSIGCKFPNKKIPAVLLRLFVHLRAHKLLDEPALHFVQHSIPIVGNRQQGDHEMMHVLKMNFAAFSAMKRSTFRILLDNYFKLNEAGAFDDLLATAKDVRTNSGGVRTTAADGSTTSVDRTSLVPPMPASQKLE